MNYSAMYLALKKKNKAIQKQLDVLTEQHKALGKEYDILFNAKYGRNSSSKPLKGVLRTKGNGAK